MPTLDMVHPNPSSGYCIHVLGSSRIFLAVYFKQARPNLGICGMAIVVTVSLTNFGHWLPQVERSFLTREKGVKMTT
jgi:hypothetical protein